PPPRQERRDDEANRERYVGQAEHVEDLRHGRERRRPDRDHRSEEALVHGVDVREGASHRDEDEYDGGEGAECRRDPGIAPRRAEELMLRPRSPGRAHPVQRPPAPQSSDPWDRRMEDTSVVLGSNETAASTAKMSDEVVPGAKAKSYVTHPPWNA